jgi:indole-3-glycerol phosphate synthase
MAVAEQLKTHLEKIHQDPLPILRKDFTLCEYHIFEARGAGADAILLIVAALDDFQLKDYQEIATELGLTVLVEVHDKDELDRSLKIKPALLGINNRNLKTFETDIQTTKDLKTHLDETYKYLLPYANEDAKPPRIISESGLKDRDTILDLKKSGVDGFLIGESLMREEDFGAKLKNLIEGPPL